MTRRLVWLGSTLAVAGTLHAAINARRFGREPAPDSTRHVSVLIPARNEAATIRDCLASLRDQEVAEILVLDDESTDGTADIVRACADPRVRLITGAAPPAGWLGKPHACIQLATAAHRSSDVLVFLDADVRLEPGAVRAAVGMLHDADLICPHPRELAVTPSERLVQPLLQWSILTTVPLRLAELRRLARLAIANGQFMVVRRDSYARAGGHAPDAVLDDIALARRIVAGGGHSAVLDGSQLASCRMYDGWAELREGYSKSLWSAFGSRPGAVAVIGVLGLAYVLPPVAAVRGSRIGLAGYAAAVAGRVITARATGGRAFPDALAHPVSICVLGWLTARSHHQHRRAKLSWRGRPL